MLIDVQCLDCKFKIKWETDETIEGKFVCEEYPEDIPKSVDDGTEDCPKFEEK